MSAAKSKASIKRSMFEIVQHNVASKPDVSLARLRDVPGQEDSALSLLDGNMVCMGCNRKQSDCMDRPFSTCSKCHAVKYCSRDCQVKDWKGQGQGPLKPRKHKDVCAALRLAKEEFLEHPKAGVTLRTETFGTWANQHSPAGCFYLHEFLARKNLLGGLDRGFWAIPDVLTPYYTSGKDCHGFQNGQILLERNTLPTIQEGWTNALTEDEQVNVTQAPTIPLPQGGVTCWQDYLTWRSLSATSVAPLLMTNVLTLYQMIQNELHLYDPEYDSGDDGEIELMVYVLAVEAELNQIPLLQELLHLMPGIRLELIYLSPAAKDLCDQAISTSDNLLTAKEHVLDVRQGKGRLRARLDRNFGLFDEVPNTIQPDAVLGLNAGLASYKTWAPAMHKLIRMGTPFCFSDQTRLIQQFAADQWLPSVVNTINQAFPNFQPLQVPHLTISLNPFHGIVGRDVAYILAPNISNGYLLTTTMVLQED